MEKFIAHTLRLCNNYAALRGLLCGANRAYKQFYATGMFSSLHEADLLQLKFNEFSDDQYFNWNFQVQEVVRPSPPSSPRRVFEFTEDNSIRGGPQSTVAAIPPRSWRNAAPYYTVICFGWP